MNDRSSATRVGCVRIRMNVEEGIRPEKVGIERPATNILIPLTQCVFCAGKGMPYFRMFWKFLRELIPYAKTPPRLAARSMRQRIPLRSEIVDCQAVALQSRSELASHHRSNVVFKNAVHHIPIRTPVLEGMVVVNSVPW